MLTVRTPQAQALVSQGAKPGCSDKQARTPAHYAAAHGHVTILEFLGSVGADLDAEDAQGRGPLHYAALGGGSRVVFSESFIPWQSTELTQDSYVHVFMLSCTAVCTYTRNDGSNQQLVRTH
jgi:hypothetical protein